MNARTLAAFDCTLLLISLLLAAGCTYSGLRSSSAPRIVAYGDSITRGYLAPEGAGWVEILSARPEYRSTQVYNAGGNGNTSTEGLQRIEADVLSHLPGLVLVEFGGNDAVHDARRHVGVDAFERNLLNIHTQVTARGGTVVFLTFPPIINAWHVTRSDPYYDPWGGADACIEQYRQRVRDVARRLGVPLFDLDRFLRQRIERDGPERYVNRDGVHLTPEANRLVAGALADFLRR